MITRELFIASMESLQDLDNKASKITEFGVNITELTDAYSTIIINLLEGLFNDKSTWISYYVYELNWGKDYKDGSIIDKEKGIIKLANASDLYDILIDNYSKADITKEKWLAEHFSKQTAYEYERGL